MRRASHHVFLPFSSVERLIDRYPHLTLFLSGLFGAILLLFFLWLTLFFGLPPARAQSGGGDGGGSGSIDSCSDMFQ